VVWPKVTERVMLGPLFDDDLEWREEAFGERPMLSPWGDPFHNGEPLECGLEDPESCESCN